MSKNKGLNANLGSVLQGMFIKNLAVPVGQEVTHPQKSYGSYGFPETKQQTPLKRLEKILAVISLDNYLECWINCRQVSVQLF